MKRMAARSIGFLPDLAEAVSSIGHSSSGNFISPAARVRL
jgi:hypothetical protein